MSCELKLWRVAVEQAWLGRLVGARVFEHLLLIELVERDQLDLLLALELVLVVLVPALVLDDVIVDAVEQRGEAVVVILAYILEGVVVTPARI